VRGQMFGTDRQGIRGLGDGGPANQWQRPDIQGKDFFVYNTGPITFTAIGQVLTGTVTIQADADFVMTHMMAESTDLLTAAGNPTQLPIVRYLITLVDLGSQRQLMDQNTPLSAICGQAPNPYEWPWWHRFARNGGISWAATNNGVVAATTLRMSFVGRKENVAG